MPAQLFPTARRFSPCALLAALALACSPAPEETSAPAEPEPIEVGDPITVDGIATAPDGVEIAYSTRGTGSPALVLLHCWSCERSFWRHQLEALAGDHRVVAIDLGGHGESGADRGEWTLEALAGDAVAVIESLGIERAIVVGHSMGAPVAIEVAQALPGTVEGVIFVDSLHDIEQEPDPEQWKAMMGAYRDDFAGTCGQMVAAMFPEGTAPELVAEVDGAMCDAPPAIGIALLEAFPRYDAAAEIAEVAVPVRAINGDMFPTDVEGNRELTADYGAMIIPGVGHFPMLEQPDELNRRLRAAVAEIEAADGDSG